MLLLAAFTVSLLFGCWLLLTAAPEIAGEGVLEVEQVQHIPLDDAGRTIGDPAFVSLPHQCSSDPATWRCAERYRFTFVHQPDRATLESLYLPHFSGSLQVNLNGALLADNHRLQPALYFGPTAPLLVPLPAPLLRPGENEIEIVLESMRLFGGFLGAAYLGPHERLLPHNSFARFAAVTFSRLVDGWMIAMGLFLLLIGILRPRERVYLIFGAVLLFFAAASIPAILPGVPNEAMLRLANISRLAGGALLLPFACHFVGRRPPVPTPCFLLLPLLAGLAIFLLPGEISGWLVRFVVVPTMVLIGLASVAVMASAALRRHGDAALLLLGAGSAALLFGAHDILVFNGLLPERQVLLSRLNAPLLMTMVGALLLWRFAGALAVMERFNLRLQQGISAAEDKLRESFAREQAQTRRAALEAERVRLMRDLHDGIGGQLVSILSLSELEGERRAADIARASRRALDDLRLVVASLEDVGDDLGLMLGMFRERIEPQLRAAGMELSWRMAELPDLPGLNPSATLNIFRILQEAVTNAVRHSGSRGLAVEAGPSPLPDYGVRLAVRDLGCGGAGGRSGGLGMGSMAQRAQALGAALSVDSDSAGTALMLDLPRRLDGPPAAAS